MRALFLSAGASASDGEGGREGARRADVESNRPSSGDVGVVDGGGGRAGQREGLRRRDGERNRAERAVHGMHGGEGESRRVKRMGRPTYLSLDLGWNSIDIFVCPEPGPSYVWGFETCLNLECPNMECGPELGPVLGLVLSPKFKMSIELGP